MTPDRWRQVTAIFHAALALPVGTRVGPYEMVGLIGVGGMGAVYRGRDTPLQRDVALKVLPAVADDPDRLARFTREAPDWLASERSPHFAPPCQPGRAADAR